MNESNNSKPFELAIAGKGACFRKGFFEILRKSNIINVKRCIKDIHLTIEYLKRENCNVTLIDEQMTGANGKCCAHIIKDKFPGTKVFTVSGNYTKERLKDLKQCGVNGVLLINADRKEIEEAFMSNDEIYYSKEIYKAMMENTKGILPETFFTEREQEVYWLLIRGKEIKQISETLHIAIDTVYGYRDKIFKKTKTTNEAQLILWSVEKYIVSDEDMKKWAKEIL